MKFCQIQNWIPSKILLLLCLVLTTISIFGCSTPAEEKLPEPNLTELESYAAEKISALREQVEQKPNDAEAWGKLAMNLDIHDYKSEAIPAYEKAIELAPDEFRWRYYLALLADESGAPETIDLYEQALKVNTDYPPLLYRLGIALNLNGQTDRAKDLLRQVANADDAIISSYGYWQLAELAVVQNELKESLDLLLKSIELNPNLREVRSMLAAVYTRLGDQQKASLQSKQLDLLPERMPIPDRFVEQLQAEGVSAFWFSQHGRRHLDFGNYEAALSAFQMENRIKPSADSHNSLGMTYQYLGQHAEAAAHFRKAIEMRKDYVEAFNNLAVSLYSMFQKQQAVDTLKRAIEIKPEYAEPYLNLGTFHIMEGQSLQAITIFNEAMEKANYDLRIGGRLAWLLATSKRDDLRNGKKAVELAKEVNEVTDYLHPDNLDILAASYAEAGAFSRAVEIASKASELAHNAKMANLAKQIDYRLDLYKKHQAYRDPEL
ncbi:tetratricopeptide repeat protein [candidate division KSB1 bacterium]|nr:tetratricopeptide repeat protein [candidate division KSB1 bacterium]